MKILLLGYPKYEYIKSIVNNLIERNVDIKILDCKNLIYIDYITKETHKLNYLIPNINGIPFITNLIRNYFLKNFMKKLDTNFDICNIHKANLRYIPLLGHMQRISKSIITTIWGSEYLRSNEKKRKEQKKIYDISNRITFNNEEVMSDFLNFYKHKYEQKTCLLRFGLAMIDTLLKLKKNEDKKISKDKLHFNKNDFIVTCGINAKYTQQHEKIIESLKKVADRFPKNTVFVFPMTYGGKKRIPKIDKLLKKSGLNYRIIQEYMKDTDLARLRRITDILVNVQITDMLSGTMQEALFSKSLVIAGSWLPYKVFDNLGVKLLYVDSVKEVGKKVAECIVEYEKYNESFRINQDIIWKMSSWRHNINKWLKVYSDCIDRNNKIT